VLSNFPQTCRSANESKWNKAQRHTGGHIVTIKNIVIPLEVEYLQEAAEERGISRSKLVRFVMEKVVNDELVSSILGEDDLSNVEPPPQKYRRFQNRKASVLALSITADAKGSGVARRLANVSRKSRH
jgi:hypothetical protein